MKKKLLSVISAAAMLSACIPSVPVSAAETSTSLYVLSNNAFTDADKQLYQDKYGIELKSFDTNASYNWDTTDLEIQQFDTYTVINGVKNERADFPAGQEMIGGDIMTSGHPTLTWSKWQFGDWETVCFDLNNTYKVKQVDMFNCSKASEGNWGLGAIEVYAGETKENMSKVWNGEGKEIESKADFDSAQTYFTRTPIVLNNAINARYVNVKFKRGNIKYKDDNGDIQTITGTNNQVRPAEFVIFGEEPTYNELQLQLYNEILKINRYIEKGSYYTAESVAALETQRDTLTAAIDFVESAEEATSYIQEAETVIDALLPAKTHYILSGNIFDDRDKALYAKFDNKITLENLTTNNPKCTLITSNSEYESNYGGSVAVLTNGNLWNNSSGLWANSWQGSKAAVSEFDLGGIYPVDRVDVINRDQTANDFRDCISKIEVYTSEDGKYYKKVAEQSASHDNSIKNNDSDKTGMYFNSIKIPVTNARYVKIIPRKQGYQQILSEITVFGYDSPLTPLTNKIEETESYLAHDTVSQYYTAESIAALENAVTAGKALTMTSPKEDITAAIEAINNARATLEPIFTRAVESGNTFTASDIKYYREIDYPVELYVDTNGATYDWAEAHDPDLVDIDSETNTQRASRHDSDRTKLTGGQAANPAGQFNTDTVWGKQGGAPAVAIFDLKENKILDRIDVFSSHEANKALGSVKIEVSTDGEAYTEVANKKASGEIVNTQITYRTQADFAPVEARYVRLSFTPHASAYLANINEVVIFGIGPNYEVLYADINKELAKYSEAALKNLKATATPDSYAALENAIAAAKEFIASQNADKDAIAAQLAALKAAGSGITYTIAETIISNNKDKEGYSWFEDLYPDYAMNNIGLTYTIDSPGRDISNSLVTNDANHIKLTDGGIGSGDNMSFGTWDGVDSYGIITVDAHKEVYFTGTDIFCWFDGNRGAGSVKIEVSSDNETWQEIASSSEAKATPQLGDKTYGQMGCDFMPVPGRYMRITVTRAKNQLVLAEMIVKAIVPQVDTLALSFESTTYTKYDANYGPLNTFEGAMYVDASGTLVNNTTEPVTANVYTAYYADGKLVKVVSADKPVTVPASGQAEWLTSAEFTAALTANTIAKTFAWDNGMKPLAIVQ